MNFSLRFIARAIATALRSVGLFLLGAVTLSSRGGASQCRVSDHPGVGEPAGHRPLHHRSDGRGGARAPAERNPERRRTHLDKLAGPA